MMTVITICNALNGAVTDTLFLLWVEMMIGVPSTVMERLDKSISLNLAEWIKNSLI